MKTTYKILGVLAVLALAISAIPNTAPVQAWFGTSGPGLHETVLIAGQNMDESAGKIRIWNSREKLHIQIESTNGWLMNTLHIYVGSEDVPTVRNGLPDQRNFPYKEEFTEPVHTYTLILDLVDDLGMAWGQPYEELHVPNIAIHSDLVRFATSDAAKGQKTQVLEEEGAWALGEGTFTGGRWAWWFKYEIAHPQRGHFIDSPVGGLQFETPTHTGKTDVSGGFDYFPGERVDLYLGSVYLGSPLAGHKISPLDIYENADTDDPKVINMARFLQSLDVDGDSKEGILVTDAVEACLNVTLIVQGLEGIDFFSDDAQTEAVIQGTLDECAGIEGVTLLAASAEDAKANLDRSLDSTMFRKDISRTPELASSKSKLNIMGVWFPALKANGDPAAYMDGESSVPGIPYYDEDGVLIQTATNAKPVVVVYTDGVEETGNEDIFAAISRDDGNTFKRMNLSRAADRSSFTLENGEEYYGQAKKPVFQVKGNNILVAWTSKYCNGGKPAYAIDLEDDYLSDDDYYTEDIWGVGGPQRSVDYADQGFPEVGEIPYSCVWVARGTIVTQGMINSSGFWADKVIGEIVWFKPERLTSGRRDANQVFMGASDGAGFAIAWQEDPDGLRPGSAAGPGPGWGGATTNHKTDIWYSYITMMDFREIDENFVIGGYPEHDDPDFVGRPKALMPMSLPVRISDNDTVNTDNLMVELGEDGYPAGEAETWISIFKDVVGENGEGSGTHAYAYTIDGLCDDFYEFTNMQGELKRVCITADDRLLDGNTGASRPNLFFQTYTNSEGIKSAWAIMAYEETKGAGVGPPEHDPEGGPYGDAPLPEVGKNAIYHSFDFQNPDLVSAGTIINIPERDAEGNLMYLTDVDPVSPTLGSLILDWQGLPQLAYENARRPRFIIQGKAAAGASNTVMLVLYKEGQEGMGRPSDIMLRRFVSDTSDNPYAPENIVCNEWELADNDLTVCRDGAQNMSTVNPTVTVDAMGIPTSEDPYGAIKVVEWEQTSELLSNASWVNPYEEARAHRGAIRGDFIVMGYSYTPNWAAARNGNDKYDFYIRRSFDGGLTWTTDPVGEGVTHCKTWTTPSETPETAGAKEEVCTTYAAGAFEEARNVSQLPNSKESVIEPRIVGAPGTIKVDGAWTGIAEDKQNPNVFYVSYGTATNPPKVVGDSDEEPEYAAPMNLYYSFSQDRGESYWENTWVVNPDSEGNNAGLEVTGWGWLAKGDSEQGEAQLRMTPDGSRFYATWLQDAEDSSDIFFRRIMPPTFLSSVAE